MMGLGILNISMDRHHIVPKHMGGTDDPDNLVELSREDHIKAHLDLYQEHGRSQDLWAARILGGYGEQFIALGEENPMSDPEIVAKMVKTRKETLRLRDEAGLPRYQTWGFRGQAGRVWYNNGEVETSCKEGHQPEGWVRGRCHDQSGEKNPNWNNPHPMKGKKWDQLSEIARTNTKPCPTCGKEMNPGNLARHKRTGRCGTE